MNYWIRPMYFESEISKEDKQTQIIKKACEIFKVSIEDLMSKRRFREVVEVRFVLFYVFHKKLNYTQNATARIFDKSHCTVIHACKVVKDLSEYNHQFKSKLKQLVDFSNYGFCSSTLEDSNENKKSMYRGLSWNKIARKWQVHIFENGKNKYLGRFKNEYEAHLTYERKRSQLIDRRVKNN